MLTGEFRGKCKYVENGCLASLQVKNLINETNHLRHLLVSDVQLKCKILDAKKFFQRNSLIFFLKKHLGNGVVSCT
jgi:hypothetical protein